MSRAADEFGGIDILVNNAGIQHVSAVRGGSARRTFDPASISCCSHCPCMVAPCRRTGVVSPQVNCRAGGSVIGHVH